MAPENIHTHPEGGREGRSQKPKLLKESMKQTVISRGVPVEWFKPKNPLWEGYGYFLGQHISNISQGSTSQQIHEGGKGFCVTRDGPKISSVTRDGAIT